MLIVRVLGAEKVVANLSRIPATAKQNVKKAISRITVQILRKVKAEKLSGQVLRNRTGTLRRSINQKVVESELGISGSVGTNLRYATRWEIGFTGPEQVRAHLRMVKQAWGRPLATPVRAEVKAFTRHLAIRPRPFLRPVLDEMRDEIRARLEEAVRGGLR